MKVSILGIVLITILGNCTKKQNNGISGDSSLNQSITDDSILTLVQYQTFNYFWEGAEPSSGMARERIHMDGIYPQQDQKVITSGLKI